MKLEKIKEGQVIKNYKELCNVLDLEIQKGGRNRKLQLQELERFFRYHKDGHKFIVDEIYEKPKEKIDNRGKNKRSWNNQNGMYGKYIRLLILHMLSENLNKNSNVNKVVIGKNKLLLELNLINQNFQYSNYNREKLANYLKIDIKFINEFFNTNTQKLKDTVKTTLNRLEKFERLIDYSTVRVIIKNDIERTHREATEEEVNLIEDLETETLKEMNIEDIRYVYISNRVKEFYKRINNKLIKHNIICSYKAYKILFSKYVTEKYKKELKKMFIDFDEECEKNELNSTVVLNLKESAKKRHIKIKNQLKKEFWGDVSNEYLKNNNYKEIVLSDDFVKNNNKIIDLVIDDFHDDVCEYIATQYREAVELGLIEDEEEKLNFLLQIDEFNDEIENEKLFS